MRAVVYARTSRGSLTERAISLMNQIRKCRNVAKKNGWLIVAEFVENGAQSSGSKRELDQLAAMMTMARSSGFEVLVTADVDRLSRGMAKQILVEEELLRYGIDVVYARHQFPNTSDGQLMKYIRVVIAEYEQVKAVERSARGLRSAVRAGNVTTGGQAPYGYFVTRRNENRQLSILDDEADIVRLIYKWYTEGDSRKTHLSFQEIASKLSRWRITTPSFNKGMRYKQREISLFQWDVTAVNRIVSSETYAGLWHFGKNYIDSSGKLHKSERAELISVEVPAIIERRIWEKARHNRLTMINRGHSKCNYLLAKRLKCFHCDHMLSIRMSRYPGNKRCFKYFCPSAQWRKKTCSNTLNFQLIALELAVLEWIHATIGETAFNTHIDECWRNFIGRVIDEMKDIDILLKKKKAQRERLIDLQEFEFISVETINEGRNHNKKTMTALENERRELGKLLREYEARVPDSLDMIDSAYIYEKGLKLDYRIRRAVIRHLGVRGVVGVFDGRRVAHINSQIGEVTFEIPARILKNGGNKVTRIELSSIGYRSSGDGGLEKIKS